MKSSRQFKAGGLLDLTRILNKRIWIELDEENVDKYLVSIRKRTSGWQNWFNQSHGWTVNTKKWQMTPNYFKIDQVRLELILNVLNADKLLRNHPMDLKWNFSRKTMSFKNILDRIFGATAVAYISCDSLWSCTREQKRWLLWLMRLNLGKLAIKLQKMMEKIT